MLALGCTGPDDDVGDDDVADDDVADDDVGDDDIADDDASDCSFPETSAAKIEVLEWLYCYTGDCQSAGWIQAWLRDGPDVTGQFGSPFYRIVLEEGGCRFLELDLGFCEPPCTYEQYCSPANECVDKPVMVPGGKLTIEGLFEAVELESEKWNPGYYYQATEETDLFAAGDAIEVQLAGDVFPQVTLEATGVEDLDTGLETSVTRRISRG